MCEVSFYRLIAEPQQYDGKLIKVVGYLTNVFGKPFLFVNQASVGAMIHMEGISLIGAHIPPGLARDVDPGGAWPVMVVGVFDAKFVGYPESAGALHDIKNIQYAGVPMPH